MVRSVHDFSALAGKRIARGTGQEDQAEVLAYGLEVLLGIVIEAGIILGLAWLLGITGTTIIVLVSFLSFRLLSGGSHCTAYYRCLLLSTAVFLSLGSLAVPLGSLLASRPWVMALAGLVAFAMTWRWAPVDTPQKPLPPERLPARRYWCQFYLLAWYVLISYLPLPPAWLGATVLGVLWQAFSVTPAGEKFTRGADFLLALAVFKKGEVKERVVAD